MINPKSARCLRNIVPLIHRELTSRLSSSPFASHHDPNPFHNFLSRPNLVSRFHHPVYRPPKMSTTANPSTEDIQCQNSRESSQSDTVDEVESMDLSEGKDESVSFATDTDDDYFQIADEVESTDLSEEEDKYDPMYDFDFLEIERGPEIVLNNCPWGEKALDIANFSWDCSLDLKIERFIASPGCIYVKLDRFMEEHVAADINQVEDYFYEYKKRLDKAAAIGEIPRNLSLEVSADDFGGRSYSFY